MKKCLSILLTIMMLMLTANIGVFAEEADFIVDQKMIMVSAGKNLPVKVNFLDEMHYDGNYNYIDITFPEDSQPFIDDYGRVQMPVKNVGEELGYTVEWNAAEQAVTLTKDEKTITFRTGDSNFTVDGKTKTMNTLKTTPIIVNDHMFVPLWYMAYAVGYEIDFYDREFVEDANSVTTSIEDMWNFEKYPNAVN